MKKIFVIFLVALLLLSCKTMEDKISNSSIQENNGIISTKQNIEQKERLSNLYKKGIENGKFFKNTFIKGNMLENREFGKEVLPKCINSSFPSWLYTQEERECHCTLFEKTSFFERLGDSLKNGRTIEKRIAPCVAKRKKEIKLENIFNQREVYCTDPRKIDSKSWQFKSNVSKAKKKYPTNQSKFMRAAFNGVKRHCDAQIKNILKPEFYILGRSNHYPGACFASDQDISSVFYPTNKLIKDNLKIAISRCNKYFINQFKPEIQLVSANEEKWKSRKKSSRKFENKLKTILAYSSKRLVNVSSKNKQKGIAGTSQALFYYSALDWKKSREDTPTYLFIAPKKSEFETSEAHNFRVKKAKNIHVQKVMKAQREMEMKKYLLLQDALRSKLGSLKSDIHYNADAKEFVISISSNKGFLLTKVTLSSPHLEAKHKIQLLKKAEVILQFEVIEDTKLKVERAILVYRDKNPDRSVIFQPVFKSIVFDIDIFHAQDWHKKLIAEQYARQEKIRKEKKKEYLRFMSQKPQDKIQYFAETLIENMKSGGTCSTFKYRIKQTAYTNSPVNIRELQIDKLIDVAARYRCLNY